MEQKQNKCDCPECGKRKKIEIEHEEINFAVLITLVPLMVLTLFGQMNLF